MCVLFVKENKNTLIDNIVSPRQMCKYSLYKKGQDFLDIQ